MADAPARPWYLRALEEASLRGWSKAELCERAGVARTTLDKWETNPRKPQARSVNAVADALGIPRSEALQLAGVIASVPEPAGDSVPQELVDAYGKHVIAAMLEEVTDPAARRRLFDRLLEARRGKEPPSGPGVSTPPGGTRRLA